MNRTELENFVKEKRTNFNADNLAWVTESVKSAVAAIKTKIEINPLALVWTAYITPKAGLDHKATFELIKQYPDLVRPLTLNYSNASMRSPDLFYSFQMGATDDN